MSEPARPGVGSTRRRRGRAGQNRGPVLGSRRRSGSIVGDTTQPRGPMNPERARLVEADQKTAWWKKWGPYLSERQWGTVREDYSARGDAWDYFPHDQARSRAYRWGEDGLAGVSDDRQRLCLSLALWNGNDPFLKERL